MGHETLKRKKEIVCFLKIDYRGDQIFRRDHEKPAIKKPANEMVGSLEVAR